MWWDKKPEPQTARREQLIAARDDPRRQIGILRAGPTYRRDQAMYDQQAAELAATLEGIEGDLADEFGVTD